MQQFEVQELRRAKDPNNGQAELDMWIVWAFEDGKGIYQMAYCPREADAYRIKYALEGHVMSSGHNAADVISSEIGERCSWCGEPTNDAGEYGLGHGEGKCYNPPEVAL